MITKRSPTLNRMRSLFPLPTRLGGLGIIESASLDKEYKNILRATQPLISRVVQQSHELIDVCEQQQSIKYLVKRLKEQETKLDAETLTSKLSNDLKRAVDLSTEKGASLWLTDFAMETHGLHLANLSFDLRYAYNMAGDHLIYLTLVLVITSALSTTQCHIRSVRSIKVYIYVFARL